MRKIILAIALVLVLIAGGLGGAVMAASPPDNSPPGVWATITEGVSEILERLDDSTLGLAAMNSKLNDIENNMIRMETMHDHYLVAANDTYGEFGLQEYPELRHVSLTFHWDNMHLPGQFFAVHSYIEGVGDVIFSGSDFNADPNGTVTIEFTTDKWFIGAGNPTDFPFGFRYNAAVTWVPES